MTRDASVLALALLTATMPAGGVQPFTTIPPASSSGLRLDAATLPLLTETDPRFQSYNIEMLEVVGGAFWKPYDSDRAAQPEDDAGHGGISATAYQYRPPIDFSSRRLIALARALGPAYLRVSGTWANSIYFSQDETPSDQPPPGFKNILSAKRWRAVLDFARSVDAEIITSFAISPGTRNAAGDWMPDQARRWLAFTQRSGGRIAAAEFMNEPSMAGIGGAPKGYDAVAYGHDFKRFKALMDDLSPTTILLGPGSATETPRPWGMPPHLPGAIATPDLMAAAGPGVDAFSYHHYGAASLRCAGARLPQTRIEDALSEEWLGRTIETYDHYAALRDRYAPGKPVWLTESADAACGGNPWSGSFTDSFRYLDQLGRLARAGVKVVAHNTLAASDYALLDPRDLTPKANYWAALLWHRLMGSKVLDSGVPIRMGMHIYAHCRPEGHGSVSLLIINNSDRARLVIDLPHDGRRYTLSAPTAGQGALLNGTILALGASDRLPPLTGSARPAGLASFAPRTISFITMPRANNPACR
ncbi:hypothetical protein ACGGKE_05790 [Sphingobium naphthae]|uniref:hypothetical protein n=1 Tax=Sphingobium naphthae TaxID=1886786 RepID=UPI0037488584